jgi:precorrin-2 methylase
MVETLRDITDLETALVLITEGASDEKRMGYDILQRMVDRKKQEVETFEAEMAPKQPVPAVG